MVDSSLLCFFYSVWGTLNEADTRTGHDVIKFYKNLKDLRRIFSCCVCEELLTNKEVLCSTICGKHFACKGCRGTERDESRKCSKCEDWSTFQEDGLLTTMMKDYQNYCHYFLKCDDIISLLEVKQEVDPKFDSMALVDLIVEGIRGGRWNKRKAPEKPYRYPPSDDKGLILIPLRHRVYKKFRPNEASTSTVTVNTPPSTPTPAQSVLSPAVSTVNVETQTEPEVVVVVAKSVEERIPQSSQGIQVGSPFKPDETPAPPPPTTTTQAISVPTTVTTTVSPSPAFLVTRIGTTTVQAVPVPTSTIGTVSLTAVPVPNPLPISTIKPISKQLPPPRVTPIPSLNLKQSTSLSSPSSATSAKTVTAPTAFPTATKEASAVASPGNQLSSLVPNLLSSKQPTASGTSPLTTKQSSVSVSVPTRTLKTATRSSSKCPPTTASTTTVQLMPTISTSTVSKLSRATVTVPTPATMNQLIRNIAPSKRTVAPIPPVTTTKPVTSVTPTVTVTPTPPNPIVSKPVTTSLSTPTTSKPLPLSVRTTVSTPPPAKQVTSTVSSLTVGGKQTMATTSLSGKLTTTVASTSNMAKQNTSADNTSPPSEVPPLLTRAAATAAASAVQQSVATTSPSRSLTPPDKRASMSPARSSPGKTLPSQSPEKDLSNVRRTSGEFTAPDELPTIPTSPVRSTPPTSAPTIVTVTTSVPTGMPSSSAPISITPGSVKLSPAIFSAAAGLGPRPQILQIPQPGGGYKAVALNPQHVRLVNSVALQGRLPGTGIVQVSSKLLGSPTTISISGETMKSLMSQSPKAGSLATPITTASPTAMSHGKAYIAFHQQDSRKWPDPHKIVQFSSGDLPGLPLPGNFRPSFIGVAQPSAGGVRFQPATSANLIRTTGPSLVRPGNSNAPVQGQAPATLNSGGPSQIQGLQILGSLATGSTAALRASANNPSPTVIRQVTVSTPPSSSTSSPTIVVAAPVPSTSASPTPSTSRRKEGCRCGNAAANPGKLTCIGQRCACYADRIACFDCKCKGCKNPYLPGSGGKKVLHGVRALLDFQTNQAIPLMTTGGGLVGSAPPGTVLTGNPQGSALIANNPAATSANPPLVTAVSGGSAFGTIQTGGHAGTPPQYIIPLRVGQVGVPGQFLQLANPQFPFILSNGGHLQTSSATGITLQGVPFSSLTAAGMQQVSQITHHQPRPPTPAQSTRPPDRPSPD